MIYVYVRRNSDGCIRMWKAADWHPHTVDKADWTRRANGLPAGKYSCDCAREKFFNWANNEGEPDKSDTCTLGQFSVLLMSADQQIVYMDSDWAGPQVQTA